MGRGSREKSKAKNKGRKQPQKTQTPFNIPKQEPTPEPTPAPKQEPTPETPETTPEPTPEEPQPQTTIPEGLNPQVAGKKPLHGTITQTTSAAEQTETPTETEPTEEKKIIPKKQETKIINKIADSVESFIKHDKPLIDTINDLRECLTVLPEDRKYEIVEYVARELANATDAEGNKLFKDETEAKQFLHTISTKTPNIRYKLPIEIQKEIKEKTPKILTSLTQRNIRSVGAANKNIYQY